MKSISARKISHAYRQVKRRYDRYGISIIQVAFNRLVLRLRTALDNLCYPFFFNKEDLESLFSSRYEFVDYSAGKLGMEDWCSGIGRSLQSFLNWTA